MSRMNTPDRWDGGLYHDYAEYDHSLARRLLTELFSRSSIKRVLDLGCGTGELTYWISTQCSVVGIDSSQSMLVVAKDMYPPLKLELRDILQLNSLGEFDLVLSCNVLHWVDHEKQRRLFERLDSLLVSGGCVYIICAAKTADHQPLLEAFMSISTSQQQRCVSEEYHPLDRDTLVDLLPPSLQLTSTEVIDESIVFESREEFRDFLLSWLVGFSFMHELGTKRDEFLDQLVTEYLNRIKGGLSWRSPRFVARIVKT